MTPLNLSSVKFSDETEVAVPQNSILVLVGSNNCGKSRALRDIQMLITSLSPDLAVVTEVGVEKPVDGDGLVEWIEAHARIYWQGGQRFATRARVGEVNLNLAQQEWSDGPPFTQSGSLYVLPAGTENRLNSAASVGSFDPDTDRPTEPLQELYIDTDLEQRLSEAAQRAFGDSLTVNRAAGTVIHLQVGDASGVQGPRDVTNAAYRDALREMAHVHEEGDGIRSYIGIVLSAITAVHPVVLLDEPEAFLHPPQARQLGRELVGLLPEGGSQFVIATHSSDFLQGLLDTEGASVTVVRLKRENNVNHASALSSQQLRDLWSDPILRYSSMLDGLFHRGVVLCEADSDCRFYQATLEAKLEREHRPAHDMLFTHTGGKHRLPTAISALRALGVDLSVVADLDVLSEKQLLKRIVEALGGSWDSLEADWNTVSGAADQLASTPSILAVKEAMEEALEDLQGPDLTKDDVKSLRNVAKLESGWARLKAGGVAVLPQGEPSQRAESLLEALAVIGLHVVPVGELERWAPAVPGHGPAWIATALEQGVHAEEGPHADFVELLAL